MYLINHLPTFIYMDDYRTFTGNAHLEEIQSRENQNRLTEADKTFLTILKLSDLDLDELVRIGQMDNTEKSRKLLRDIDDGATILTGKIKGRFPQRNYKVRYRVVNSLFFTYVTDDHDLSLIELEERSKGFQWDFSFELMLMHETKETFKDCVILLDEPGLHLHPTAQGKLLSSLEKYAKENTLLYTTHLPFMIDLKHPERIRVLAETENGSVVTNDFVESSLEARRVRQSTILKIPTSKKKPRLGWCFDITQCVSVHRTYFDQVWVGDITYVRLKGHFVYGSAHGSFFVARRSCCRRSS